MSTSIFDLKRGDLFKLPPEFYPSEDIEARPVFVFEKMDGMYGHGYWQEEPDVPLYWSGPVEPYEQEA